jgi:hypothetical protein
MLSIGVVPPESSIMTSSTGIASRRNWPIVAEPRGRFICPAGQNDRGTRAKHNARLTQIFEPANADECPLGGAKPKLPVLAYFPFPPEISRFESTSKNHTAETLK